MKYWEIVADKLSKAGFSWGCSSQIDMTTGPAEPSISCGKVCA